MKEPEAALNHGEFDHGEDVDGKLLVLSGEASALLEPADHAFDDVAVAIPAAVELRIGGTRGPPTHYPVTCCQVTGWPLTGS